MSISAFARIVGRDRRPKPAFDFSRCNLLSDLPFTHLNVPNPEQRAAWLSQLDEMGVRLFPPPFGHAVAILSDIDDADRTRTDAYHTQLVTEHGLDFGDSMWLYGRTYALEESNPARTQPLHTIPGLGIIHPSGDPDAWTKSDLSVIRSYREMIAGCLRGQYDHFHAFLPAGSRIAWLRNPTVCGADAVFTPGALEHEGLGTTAEMRVAGLGVVGTLAATRAVRCASVTGRDPSTFDTTPPRHVMDFAPGSDDGAQPTFGDESEQSVWLTPARSIGATNTLNHLWLTDEIRIVCETPEAAAQVRALAVANVNRSMVLDTLRELRQTWNIETSLITEHSGYCFFNERSLEYHTRLAGEQWAKACTDKPDTVAATRIGNAEGPDHFVAIADDPGSFACFLPELTNEIGFRFVNAGGLTGSPDYSYDASDIVAPSRTRSDAGLYICRRTMPNLPDDVDHQDRVLKPNRAPSFGHRLRRLYELMADHERRIWPIYTHLGSVQPMTELPEPYLDQDPIRELQDRVYGITGTHNPSSRCWFTRGTGLCEHALLMQRIASHIDQPDADSIIIRKWHDDVLGTDLPVSINQTYGLTFLVDNLSKAQVMLEDKTVLELARFDHPDGRWVTLMPSIIREVVFNRVNPFERADSQASTTSVRVIAPDDLAFLRLESEDDAIGTAAFKVSWINPAGMQGFTYHAEAHGEGDGLAWLVETNDRGRFAWGDAAIVDSLDDLTAWRHEVMPASGQITVPFWDMVWSADASPGGPLPNRAVKRMSMLVRGRVSVMQASFIRPSAAQSDVPANGTVVAGRVPNPRWTVWLQDEAEKEPRSTSPDPIGWFAFSGVDHSRCRVWAETDTGERIAPLGGEAVESAWNQTALTFHSLNQLG